MLGLGVGVATTVASVTLMAATPAADVGGAAAIEETCYELGAALGVAILGSLATALYRNGLPALGLDGPTAASVRDSVGEAAHVAHDIGGSAGNALLHTVATAYTNAITPAFLAAGGLALAAAAMAWTLYPPGSTADRQRALSTGPGARVRRFGVLQGARDTGHDRAAVCTRP